MFAFPIISSTHDGEMQRLTESLVTAAYSPLQRLDMLTRVESKHIFHKFTHFVDQIN